MAESEKKIVKIIHESGKRVYSTYDPDLAYKITRLDIFKNGLDLLGPGVFGWVFEARTSVDADNLEARILKMTDVEIVISDLRPKRD